MRHISYCFFLLIAALTACSKDDAEDHSKNGGITQISAWAHSGQENERQTIKNQVARFNTLHDDIYVKLTIIPEGTYNAQAQAAALAQDLPCVLEFDGPFLYNYVWQGHLMPLDDLLPNTIKEDLIPSILAQGTYRGRIYSVGTFDSGLGIYARRDRLQAVGARIPSAPENAWSVDEFDAILAALAEQDDDGAVLDLKLNYSGEWFTYAFSPLLQSAGADLIDRVSYQSADGVLNSAAAIGAMRRVQSWLREGYVDPNIDDAAFVTDRVALSWVGHWQYRPYAEELGDNLVVLPLPDFGHGTKTGLGSWAWAITASCKQPEAAMQFLAFLLQPEEVLAMTDANAAVPATRSALAKSQLYSEQGPLRLFARQLTEGYAVPRPQSPAYPVITSAFQQALDDIRNGADVQSTLDKAVAIIDQDIADNKGYPP